MGETVVGILGFLTIVAIVVTLFKSKTLPSIAFIVFPSILALILVMGIYLLLYLLDDTIKSSDDIEKYLESNTLAVIPLRSGEKRENRGIRSVFRFAKNTRRGSR